jgi:hypothetical protein
MQPFNRLTLCEEELVCIRARLVATLGSDTARVLLAWAIEQTARRHPEIALIRHDDTGVTFEALEKSYGGRPQEEITVAFNDLSTELLLILTRLLDIRARWQRVWLRQAQRVQPCE